MYGLYADESRDDNTSRFTVAAYLIGSKAAIELTDKWATALGSLEYFHMKEGHHSKYPDIYAKLLDIMADGGYLVSGFVASVLEQEYKDVMQQKLHGQSLAYWFGGAYPICVGAIASLVNKWLDANNPNERDLAYVFDAGSTNQGDADRHLRLINTDDKLSVRKRELRYYSHSFMDSKRRDAGHLQAADILAWNITNSHRAGMANAAFKRLLDTVNVYSVHYSSKGITDSLQAQLDFCDFYGQLKQAKQVRP